MNSPDTKNNIKIVTRSMTKRQATYRFKQYST